MAGGLHRPKRGARCEHETSGKSEGESFHVAIMDRRQLCVHCIAPMRRFSLTAFGMVFDSRYARNAWVAPELCKNRLALGRSLTAIRESSGTSAYRIFPPACDALKPLTTCQAENAIQLCVRRGAGARLTHSSRRFC
jgi:hypothetical protein